MSKTENTLLLKRGRQGDTTASNALSQTVYERLRTLAANQLHRERRGHSLRATDLVHEAFLSLVDETSTGAPDRAHFIALAAHAMRRILIVHARKRASLKRGGGRAREPLFDSTPVAWERESDPSDILDLDNALRRLAEIHPRMARGVELRFFGGATFAEIGHILDVSHKTAEADWTAARAWLYRELATH